MDAELRARYARGGNGGFGMSAQTTGNLSSVPQPGSTRELLWVALPLMISFGSQSLMHFVDRMLLTWYSQAALAATMPAGLLSWTLMSLAFGVAGYTGTFIAQYEGAGRKDRVAAVVWQAVWLSLGMGAVLSLLSLAAPWIFNLLDHPEEVQRAEVIYFSTLMVGAPAALLMTSLSGFFSGRNQTTIVMLVNFFAVLVNLLLDLALIFGWGPFPELGILGAGLATVLANVVATVVFAGLVLLVTRWQHYPLWEMFSWDRELSGRMIRYGVPMGTQTFVDISGFTMFAIVIGSAGTIELAASNLAFNLNCLAFIPMIGLGVGVMTLVGRRVGEGQPHIAQRTVRKAMYLAWFYMGMWCVAYLSFPRLLLAPFAAYAEGTQFAETEELVIILLRFVAVYGLLDAMGVIYGYAIRGAGDTFYPLLYFLVASVTCLIVPTLLIWRYAEGNLFACWGAATVYVSVIGIGMYVRYRSGAWLHLRVIESTAELQLNAPESSTPLELTNSSLPPRPCSFVETD